MSVLIVLADTQLKQGDTGAAAERMQRTGEIARAVGNSDMEAALTGNVGVILPAPATSTRRVP